MGDSLQSKIKTMGNTDLGTWQPQIGDMVIQDVGTINGHVRIINSINNGIATFTESNLRGDRKITNNETMDLNNTTNLSKIKAVHRGDLKPEFQSAIDIQKQTAQSSGDIFGKKLDYIKSGGEVTVDERKELEAVAQLTGRTTELYDALTEEKEITSYELRQLRKEVYSLPVVKTFNDYKQQYTVMQSAYDSYKRGEIGANVGDQALGVLFQKMLDPGSVVREGEFTRTSSGQDVQTAIYAYKDKLLTGGQGIDDKTREDLVRIGKEFTESTQKKFNDEVQFYVEESDRLGVDPERMIGSYYQYYTGTKKKKAGSSNSVLTDMFNFFGGGANLTADYQSKTGQYILPEDHPITNYSF